MRIVFDPEKDAINLSKHGVSLAAAADLDSDAALAWIDDRADYGEQRIVRREVSHYVKAIQEGLDQDADT